MFDVKEIIQTRFPAFSQRHARTARILSRFLSLLFYETRFQQFERNYPHLEGLDFVEQTLRYFDFRLRVREDERARIPATGRVVIAANHPIGSLDGLSLLHLVRQVRADVKVVANELLSEVKPLHPLLLPVNNMGGQTARNNLKNIKAHLESEGALIIFPAGEVSRLGSKGVKDGEWHSGFVKMARTAGAPILPVYVAGRNSLFFYSLSALAKPLSTLWLIREMFKQSHNTIDARIGRPVTQEIYDANQFSAKQLARMFRKHVYRMARDGKPIFRSVDTVAAPENRQLLNRELLASERLGQTRDGKHIYLCRMGSAPCVMREIGRLREIAFRSVGEGSGLPRDIDRYDATYLQLVLWDSEALEIAGAYRIGDAKQIIARQGLDGLYTQSLFRFGESTVPYLEHGLELGRSFVQPRYQNKNSLDYLWYGIGAYLGKYPHYRYLYGPASISRYYGREGIAMLAHYFSGYYNSLPVDVSARDPFVVDAELSEKLARTFSGEHREQDFKTLKRALKERGLPVPPLYKHYSQATDTDGVTFTAFNIDRDFGDCVDGFVIADLERLTEKKRQRYLSGEDNDNGGNTD
ncbi:lysophospholipid acyltransferase family protein [Parahalioglobus pacificus]|uniref:L-ornithine N(alpha)-acyltransferase n=1 Tax=Parahalioglobus pacificus TaxID=930806 RepID=A0A918XHK2_9GAMM|nr:lysophospholipid acyltransferase family protein [Halioglobus pacificus]GHD31018.1 acyltransferase [Halioglobus pacificus]